MNWNTIRLELASTVAFPRGSASRSFLLRLPLNEGGSIDDSEFERDPFQATVRRYWASEPDQVGKIQRENGAWLLHCDGERGKAVTYRLGASTLRPDLPVTIEMPDGSQLPFRVSSINPFGVAAAPLS